MDIVQKLKEIGLNVSEGAVYLYLLKNGLSTPPQIAKGTKIARTNTYHLLRSLQEKNIIQRQKNRKRFAYIAKNPDSLLSQAEHVRQATEDLLPDLKALHKTSANKPSIEFFDGWDEVQKIYFQSLEAESIYALGSTKKLSEFMGGGFFANYEKEVKKRHIIIHDILTDDSKATGAKTQAILGPLYNAIYLDAKHGELATDMLIWDDHIALISLENPIFGTVITNANLAKTFRALHRILRS